MSAIDYNERRAQLAKQIAGQRQALSEAYRDLGKPLHYAQAGFKGYQALRQNAWLIALAPSVIGIISGLVGLRKTQDRPRPKWPFFFGKGKAATGKEAEEVEAKASRQAKPLLRKLLGHGVTAFKIYRRVRPFIPL